MINKKNLCKICGYSLGYSPWDEDENPDYSICPCCGCEAGNDDYTDESINRYRNDWLQSKLEWFDSEKKPIEWNLAKQLKLIGVNLEENP